MTVFLDIERYDPRNRRERAVVRYEVQVEPTDRVLDAIMNVKRNQDGSLGFRKSCAHGVCGSDAMMINEKERLACKTLIRDVASEEGAVISLKPLKHLEIQKDLMVDQQQFFEKYRSVKPFLMAEKSPIAKERIQSQGERGKFDDPTKCILCSACYSACPILDENQRFVGPAAIVQASRFLNDSRDEGFTQRLDVLDESNGVWSCENHFQCTRVCPRGIKITKLINQTKRQIKAYGETGEKP